ncbi:MAG: LysR substrate-binding domain-containing protein [Ramlibacter sp.]
MDRADLELVLAIRDQGSLSAAAESLGLAAPAVTKRLASLESRLGARLFQRTTRRVSATSEGDAICERAVHLLRGFQDLEAELQERQTEPAGTIRLVSTFGFGRLWLAPALATFQQKHPRLSVQLQLTEQLPELGAQGFDGSVWLWSVQDRPATQWVSRRLARNQRVLAASSAYLREHGMPADLQDLQKHACLVVRENGAPGQRFDAWLLQRERDKAASRVLVSGPLSSNSGEVVRDWCLAGRGIMLRSLWDIAPELASGRLVRVLPAWTMIDADIHWLAPFRPQVPRRIRLLVDFLAEQFRAEPWKAISRSAPPGSRRTR